MRPNGGVLIDSLHPFVFGRVEEGLATAWDRIVHDWQDPEIVAWANGIPDTRGFSKASVVPYADEEVAVGGAAAARYKGAPGGDAGAAAVALAATAEATGASGPRLPKRSASSLEVGDAGDVAASHRMLTEMALARRHRLARHRWAGQHDGERYVRLLSSGRVLRLNRTGGLLMDEFGRGTVGEALDVLIARYPQMPRADLELDVLRTVRTLRGQGLLIPERAVVDRSGGMPDALGADLPQIAVGDG